MVAVKVGYSFCLFNVFGLRNANLERTGVQVKVNGCLYNLFKGIQFEDSRIIDEIIDLYHKHEFKIDDYMV